MKDVKQVAKHCSRSPVAPREFRRAGIRQHGSATVEFVLFVPFLLVIMALVWDVREQLGFRTDIARQVHVAAAAVADDPEGGAPFDAGMAQLRALLRRNGVSGSIAAAVVTRGTDRRDGAPCPADAWCPPVVATTWPVTATDGAWSRHDADGCATAGADPLPATGDPFEANQTALPHEARAGDESAWISRNLGPDEWWVVLDVCFEPRGGTFSGRLANLPLRLFDARPVLRRRIAWGSIHELGRCDWCVSAAPQTEGA